MLPRTGITHIVTDQRELRKILFEARGKISSLAVKGFLVRPRIPRNEPLARYIRATRGRGQPKDSIMILLPTINSPTVPRTHPPSSVVDLITLPNPLAPPHPP